MFSFLYKTYIVGTHIWDASNEYQQRIFLYRDNKYESRYSPFLEPYMPWVFSAYNDKTETYLNILYYI